MKFHLPSLVLSASVVEVLAAGHVERAASCDVSRAYSVLTGLSTGSAFCSSYIHVTAVSTKTKTTTVTITGECTTSTKTKTSHATFTSTVYGKTTTLPTLTFTEYSSSVLIPSGPTPTVNKRSPDSATPANQAATPTGLTTCSSQCISSACSTLLGPTVSKITITSTKTKTCMDTTTVTTTTTDHTTTTKIPFLVSPPPIILTSPGVLTTTVPAACAESPYFPSGNGDGNEIIPLGYPYFPQTGVECCVICYTQQNCIASAAIFDGDNLVECDMLIHVNGTQPGTNALCPLGVQDYPFGTPDPAGDIYPGPCGK